MALLFNKISDNKAHLGLWKIEESEDFFLQKLDLQPVEREELSPIKGFRRLEWLAGRHLVQEMLQASGATARIPVLKDEFGKPHIWESPFHLSFSHSHGYVAAILAEEPVGIDIQRFASKIGRLAHKFMRPVELESLEESSQLEHLCFYWCAKESLYKAYGRREIDFRRHLLVNPFEYRPSGTTTASVQKGDFHHSYDIWFEKIGEYFLAYCLVQESGAGADSEV